jgi:hypothetical protein
MTGAEIKTTLRRALNELGVPSGDYPAPVSNAIDILESLILRLAIRDDAALVTLNPGVRLVRVWPGVFDAPFGARTEDGLKLTVNWGEPDAEGIWEPVFTATDDGSRIVREDRPTLNEYGRAACICGASVLPENWTNHLRSQQRGPHAALKENAALLDEMESLRAVAEAAEAHGFCTCYPCYPRSNRHAPECDDDPDLRAALARLEVPE